jgi:ABC-type spermidine/putrescine transport system permease subunit I
MWDANGPVWTHPGGPIGLAPEASEIVGLTVRTRPWQVLWSATQNTVTQLTMVKLFDTIQPDGLDQTVVKSVEKFFPSAELERYKNAKQVQGTMLERVSFVSSVGTVTVLLGFLLSIYLLRQAWRRRDWTVLALITMIWIGVLANAFATGGLSKPHYRYQTRIAWLLVLPPLLLWPYKKKSDSALQSRSS